MSPDERQLLVDLFDRIRQGSISPRDREAESFISDQVLHSPMRRTCWRRRSSSKIKRCARRMSGCNNWSSGFRRSRAKEAGRSRAPSSVNWAHCSVVGIATRRRPLRHPVGAAPNKPARLVTVSPMVASSRIPALLLVGRGPMVARPTSSKVVAEGFSKALLELQLVSPVAF
jgi:hypothetical protein